MGSLREAIAFLTPVLRTKSKPSPETLAFFPLVGAGVGLVEGVTWWAARRVWPPITSAVITTACNATLTGALHLDGVADAADGLFAHVPSKERLDIMAEPEIGTFGALAVWLATLARAASLAEMAPSPILLGALGCGSKSVMVLATRILPYARPDGLVSAFLLGRTSPDRSVPAGLMGLAATSALAFLVRGRRGFVGILAGSAASAGVLIGAHRRLGGMTGDVIGAAGVAFETASLLVWSAR